MLCDMLHSSDNPNHQSSGKVRFGRNDFTYKDLYDPRMAKKSTPPRAVGPDWFLAEWMATKQVTQAELGRRCGWSKATVNDIYHGKTEYYRVIVNQVAAALQLHPWELLMPPAEANRIKRWRAAFEQEAQLRAAEDPVPFTPSPAQQDRLLPRKAS